MNYAQSPSAAKALALVRALQRRMVDAQQAVAASAGDASKFTETTWLRDDGRHGGGNRFGLADTAVFDRASVNVSQVHYDDEPARALASATALSTIIHPRHPHASHLKRRSAVKSFLIRSGSVRACERCARPPVQRGHGCSSWLWTSEAATT